MSPSGVPAGPPPVVTLYGRPCALVDLYEAYLKGNIDVSVLMDALRKMGIKPPTPDELERAKQHALNSTAAASPAGYGGAGGAGGALGMVARTPPPYPNPPTAVWGEMFSPLQMIAMRLHIPEGTAPFHHINAFRLPSGRYAVTIVPYDKDEVVTLYDDAELFPSDGLIGKIRLLQG